MKKRLLLFLFFLFHTITVISSQSPALQDLFQSLETAREDTDKVDIFHAIGKKYYDLLELDSASIFFKKASDLAEVHQLNDRKTKAIYWQGLVFRIQGKDSLAIAYLVDAKTSFERAKKEYDRFNTHVHLGFLYGKTGNIQLAVSHFDSAEIFQIKNNLREAYELNRNLGGFLWYQKKYKEARNKYLNTIKLATHLNDSTLLYHAYGSIGSLYNDLQKPDSAIYYLEMALPVIQVIDPQRAACLRGCLATNYKDQGNCNLALENFHKSLAIFKNPDKSFECLSFAEMASCYLLEGDLEKANYYNDLAIRLLDKATDLHLKRDAFEELVSLYKKSGDYERAFLNLENLTMLEDTLFKTENILATQELQVKYQTREQETQMELQDLKLSRQSAFILVIAALLILLLIILFLGWRNILHRKRSHKLLSQHNDQLKDLDQKKSRFFSNISHELRTPLTLISAPLESMLEEVMERDINDNLQLAHRNSQKLLVLVDEILDLSKLESGQMQLHFSAVHLEEVLRRFFYAFQSLANIRRLILEFNSRLPKNIWVNTDLPKLEKMLNNLLSNAIKYSDSGGRVMLDIAMQSTLSNEEKFIIQVSDTGQGIHEEDLAKIFDRFYQSNSGQLVGGTGIGLALTKELANLFGGNITVKSKLGKGSTFTLTLPLIIIDEPAPFAKAIPVITSINKKGEEILNHHALPNKYVPLLLDGQKPRILLVEDNPEMSRFLQQTLSPNYECEVAHDGEEALKFLETAYFDLVTSDVMMPQMDGFELLEKVRKEGTIFKNIPFILLTARSLETDKLEGFHLGVDDYITKPFSVKELKARIHNLLKNKQRREEWEKGETADKTVLKTAEQFVLDHISDASFGVHHLSAQLTMSQRSLERLIKRLTGLSPVGFIREIRLQKGYQLLKRRQYLTVTEVRYAVGIENASYFNRKFKERFGVIPKELMKPVLKENFS